MSNSARYSQRVSCEGAEALRDAARGAHLAHAQEGEDVIRAVARNSQAVQLERSGSGHCIKLYTASRFCALSKVNSKNWCNWVHKLV